MTNNGAKKLEDFNQKYHPERRADEVFIMNVDSGDFLESEWKTKRLGIFSYDDNGLSLMRPGSPDGNLDMSKIVIRPLFVNIEEVRARANEGSIYKEVLNSLVLQGS